jgi:hypothetical protein
MPNEPERPVEKLLRASAEKRRAEAGQNFELHPASRRILQDEVQRTYADKASKPRWLPGSWASFWPKLGYSFATIVALALAVKLMLPGVGPTKTLGPLAKNENTPVPVLTKASKEAPAQAVNAPSLATVQPEPPTSAVSLALADQKAQVLPDGSVRAGLDQLQPGKDVAVTSQKFRENELLSAAPAAAQPKSFMLSQSDAEVARQVGRTEAPQQLVKEELERQAPSARWSNTLPATPILASFRVEMNGQEIRIIDKDGSIYTGTVTPPQAAVPVTLARAAKADSSSLASREARAPDAGAVAKMRAIPQQDSFSFRVTGTNLSLKQAIAFRGQLLPLAQSSVGSGITTNATTANSRSSGTVAPTPLPSVPESRVVGAVSIGGGAEIQINALPVK